MLVTINGKETEVIADITEVSKKIYNEISNVILENLNQQSETITFSNIKISKRVLSIIFENILPKNPQYMSYIDFGIGYDEDLYYETGLEIVTFVLITYNLSSDEISERNLLYESILAEISNEIKYLKTDLDKVLFLCNYFKKGDFTAYYDYNGTEAPDIYSVFKTKNAIPFSYTYALGYLFTNFNINYQYVYYSGNTYYGISIFLNGEWYFVDIGLQLLSTSCLILKSLNNEVFGVDQWGYYLVNVNPINTYPTLGTDWELAPGNSSTAYSTKYDWLDLG